MTTTTFANETLPMKVFDLIVLLSALAFNYAVLQLDWSYVAVAAGGSLSGAVILAYFRRDPRKGEQVFKSLCAMIGGLVLGAAADEFFAITNPKYILALFFVTSMISLALLQGLLSITEKNAAEICKETIQRLFGLNLDARQNKIIRRRKKRRGDELTILPLDDEPKE